MYAVYGLGASIALILIIGFWLLFCALTDTHAELSRIRGLLDSSAAMDISKIERRLSDLHEDIQSLHSTVGQIETSLSKLAGEHGKLQKIINTLDSIESASYKL